MAMLIEMSAKRDKTLSVAIRTCKEWEDFISGISVEKRASSVCSTGKEAIYYSPRGDLPRISSVNDVDYPIISGGEINSGILRIKGISEGINLSANVLISKDNLLNAMNKFKEQFKVFFRDNIKPVEVKFSLTYSDI